MCTDKSWAWLEADVALAMVARLGIGLRSIKETLVQQELVSSIGGRQIVSDNSEWKERVCMEHGHRVPVACH